MILFSLSVPVIFLFKIKIPLALIYSAKSLVMMYPSLVFTLTSFSKIEVSLLLSIEIFFDSIKILSAKHLNYKKKEKINKILLFINLYYSNRCKK